MQCPQCQGANPDGARFCLHRGARLTVVCPQCGTDLPPQARFCFVCGTAVGAPPPEARGKPAPAALAEALRRLVPKGYAERLLGAKSRANDGWSPSSSPTSRAPQPWPRSSTPKRSWRS
ncbi:MAG: zinc-ribbon domain-containing protein [Chloroflexi bacterium]|nr:zinc-ribbon domain-containing protein [Chloroflexota bacterium]